MIKCVVEVVPIGYIDIAVIRQGFILYVVLFLHESLGASDWASRIQESKVGQSEQL